jgi:hypothetical protein
MTELMNDSSVMNLTLFDAIRLETVEKLSKAFQMPTPWNHEKLGNRIPKIAISEKLLKADQSLYKSITEVYGDRLRMSPQQLNSHLAKTGIISFTGALPISATQLYKILKTLKLKPEDMLKRVKPVEYKND